MRDAHKSMKLDESHWDATVENLVKSLKDHNVPEDIIGEIGAIAGSVKNDVLNKWLKNIFVIISIILLFATILN